MTYHDLTHGRAKIAQLHAEAARGRLARSVQRRRFAHWLRRIADRLEVLGAA